MNWYLIGGIAEVAWGVYLILRRPQPFDVPSFMRRLDGAKVDEYGAKVVDFCRAAAWIFLGLILIIFGVADLHGSGSP